MVFLNSTWRTCITLFLHSNALFVFTSFAIFFHFSFFVSISWKSFASIYLRITSILWKVKSLELYLCSLNCASSMPLCSPSLSNSFLISNLQYSYYDQQTLFVSVSLSPIAKWSAHATSNNLLLSLTFPPHLKCDIYRKHYRLFFLATYRLMSIFGHIFPRGILVCPPLMGSSFLGD